jgi:hypothetical protein
LIAELDMKIGFCEDADGAPWMDVLAGRLGWKYRVDGSVYGHGRKAATEGIGSD